MLRKKLVSLMLAVSMLTATVIGSASVAEVPAYAYSSKKFKENTHAKQLSKEANPPF